MIKVLYAALAVALIGTMTSVLNAAEVHVVYPQSSPACDYFQVNATASHASAGIEWQLADQEAELWIAPDGRRALIRVPTPRLLQLIAIARDVDGRNAVKIISVNITGESPEPRPPAPKPEPSPKPDVAPSPPAPVPGPTVPSFGLVEQVKAEALKVKSEDLKAEAAQFAALCVGVKAKIKAGELQASSPAEIGNAIDSAVKALPKDVQKRWLPTFGKWWTVKLKSLFLEGKLNTTIDWCVLIDETSAGLMLVQ